MTPVFHFIGFQLIRADFRKFGIWNGLTNIERDDNCDNITWKHCLRLQKKGKLKKGAELKHTNRTRRDESANLITFSSLQ